MAKAAARETWYVRLTSHSRPYPTNARPWSETGSRTKCEAALIKHLKTLDADGERYLVEWHLTDSGDNRG